ncbi:MAG: TolC family protein [Acidobacteriota bacterium]
MLTPLIGPLVLVAITASDPDRLHEVGAVLGDPLDPATWPAEEAGLVPQVLPDGLDASSLDELIDFGLTHDAGLRAAFERWRAAEERVPQARALPDPTLTFVQFLEEIQTRTGPQRRQLGVSQLIPGPGKRRLREEVARHEAERRRWELEARRLSLVHDITNAHLDYAYLARELRITQDNLELLKRLEPIVQRRVQAGDGQAGLLRMLVEIGKLENEVISLRDRRPVLSARLDALLNREPLVLLPWPVLAEPSGAVLDAERLGERLTAANPGLQALRVQVEADDAGGELARTTGRPDTTVGLTWFDTSDAPEPRPRGSGDDPLAVTVSVSLPVWRQRVRAASAEAEHERRASRAELRRLEALLAAELQEATFRHEDAARQLRLHRDSLMPRARQALVVTEAAYRTGSAEVLELIESQRVLLDFERAYWRACRDQAQQRARLVALVGGELP